MRTSRIYLGFCVTVVVTALFVFSACRKNRLSAEDTGYASDHASSEQTFNDVQSIADQASTVSTGSSLGYRTTGSGCATVTKTPGTITIDFGGTDCLCHDGRYRRGKIIVTYTGNYADVGSSHTITFDNFYQNDNKVTGAKTVTNIGPDAGGHPQFQVHIEGSVTLKGGGTISATWDRLRVRTKGYDTPADITDDEYQVSGTGNMTRANGMVVNVAITVPLVVAFSCHWIESGTVTYSLAGNVKRTLDFGDTPVCDDMATVTMANGAVKNITLP